MPFLSHYFCVWLICIEQVSLCSVQKRGIGMKLSCNILIYDMLFCCLSWEVYYKFTSFWREINKKILENIGGWHLKLTIFDIIKGKTILTYRHRYFFLAPGSRRMSFCPSLRKSLCKGSLAFMILF